MTVIAATATDQTAEIQAAIDRVSATGGGRVELAAGEHLCGGLRLRDGVELHLAQGAVLRLTPDYADLAGNAVSVIAEGSDRGLIVGQGVRAIALTGPGEIAAPGRAYIAGDDPEVGTWVPAVLRPRVLVLEDCEDVAISGLRITDSPMWTMHLVNCRKVLVRGARVENDRRLPNTDGLVIDSCHDVRIEGVTITTADDGICLKTTRRAAGIGTCERVSVRHCTISSQSCALKIGTESFGDLRDIVFEDCVVTDSNRALGIFSRDGGRISGVRFSRIKVECHETPDGFWGSGEALTITVVDRRPERPAGAVEDIVVEEISGVMEGAIALVSTAAPITDVLLRSIVLTQRQGALGTGRRYDLRPTPADLAPAPGASGRANAWTRGADDIVIGLVDYPGGGLPGLFLSGVAGVTMDDVVVTRG